MVMSRTGARGRRVRLTAGNNRQEPADYHPSFQRNLPNAAVRLPLRRAAAHRPNCATSVAFLANDAGLLVTPLGIT
jgi:hypothetical protein